MFKNKIILIVILLVGLIAISTVNAEEISNETTDLATEEIDDSIIGSSNDDYVGDSSDGTFTDLANEIAKANGELNLTRNYVYSSEDSSYYGGIIIEKEIMINGNGFTINGNNQARAFHVSYGNIILKNISFVNCYGSNRGGGSIYWEGVNGNLFNCCFINSSSWYNGGSVHWKGVNGSLFNCSFINSNNKHDDDGYAGSIYWEGVNGSLFNCNFINSSCRNKGGSIYWEGVNGSLFNCCFINSSAYYSWSLGGSVYWNGVNGLLFNCCFINSSSWYNGGSVFCDGVNCTLFNCYFINSKSICGGSVYWKCSNSTLFNCYFLNSSAKNDGGSVYWNGSNTRLFNCTFKYSSGGSVYWNGFNNFLFNCTFKYSSGGSVFCVCSNSSLFNCSFVNSSAGEGGSIRLLGSNCSLFNCSFVNSSASDGGSVFWYGYGGNLFNCSFVYSNASVGGSVRWNGDRGNLFNCNFINSHADYGVSVFWNGDNGKLFDCIFVNSTFNDNEAHVYWVGSNGTLSSCIYKLSSNIKISCEDMELDEIATIDYNITKGTTGILSVYLNDTFVKNVSVGSKIKLDNLKAGKYIVKVKYNSDGYYASCEDTTVLEVYKLEPRYYYIDDEFVAGDNKIINIEFDSDVVGFVNVSFGKWKYIDDDNEEWISKYNFTSKLNNGVASITIPKLTGGKHDLTIDYGGSDRYYSVIFWDSIDVEYKNSPITLNINDVTWGDSINIKPTLPAGATGNITVLIDNENICNMTVGESYKYTTLIGGKHTLTIKYKGDEYYSSNETTIEFNVAKLNSTFSIENTFDANPYITIPITLANDASGNITVTINNKEYKGTVINGTFNFTVYNLGNGSHNAIINYTGDDKYNSMYLAKEITVNLKKSTITTDINNILTGNNLVLKPTVTTDATGTVSVYVDNTLKTTINVGSSYTISKPSIGKHEVRLVYNGNSYFESSEFSSVFRVFTIYPIVTVDTQIIPNTNNYFKAQFYDEYGEILSNKYVLFNVNGSDYTVMTNDDGIATLNINLPVGEYNVTTVNMLVNENTTNKLLVFHSVVADNIITESGDVEFKATFLDESAKALSNTYVVFIVDGAEQSVRTDVNGIATLKLSLTSGTHTITSINTLTNENTTNKVRIVSSIDSIINMAVTNASYTSSPRLTINVDSSYLDADVIVTVTGDNGYSNNFTQKASKSIIKQLNGLNAGKYSVDVKYESTDGFTIQLNDTFTVFKINPEIIINTDNIYVGQTGMINVSVGNSNGSVTVKLGSKTFEKQLINGTASINVDDLVIGNYSVDVIFNGDNNYNPLIKSANFTVSKIPTSINVLSYYSEYGNGLAINLSASADGKITVTFDDEEESINVVAGRVYEVVFDGYYSGRYDINVDFIPSNSDNYDVCSFYDSLNIEDYYPVLPNPDTYLFELMTNKSSILLSPDKINWFVKNVTKEGELYSLSTFTLNNVNYVIIGDLDSGMVYKIFNPKSYSLYDGIYYKINNNKISDVIYQYEVLDNSYYNFVGRIYGIYLDEWSPSYIVINNICYKNDGFLHEAVENVDYKIINNNYYTIAGEEIESYGSEDGWVVINSTLYDVYDNFYYAHMLTTLGQDYILINNSYCKIIYGNGTIDNNMYALVNGQLHPIINNTISSPVNLTPIKNNTINKIATKISATNVNMVYNGGKSIIITLKDANNNKLVNMKVTITVNGKTYTRTTNSKGQATISVNLLPKTYTATIKFAGSSNYYLSSTKSTVKITKATPKLTASAKTYKVKTKTKKYTVTLKTNKNQVLKNAKVTVKVNGKTYTAKTNSKGIATFKLNKLTKKGNFKTVVKFAGNSYYKAISKTVKIVVKK